MPEDSASAVSSDTSRLLTSIVAVTEPESVERCLIEASRIPNRETSRKHRTRDLIPGETSEYCSDYPKPEAAVAQLAERCFRKA